MDRERSLQVRISRIDRRRLLRIDLERLEKRPVAHIVAEPRAVVDTVEAVVEYHARDTLSKRPQGELLQNTGVKFRDAERNTKTSKFFAQDPDPIARINVGIRAVVKCAADHASFCPFPRDLAQRREVVLAFDLGQFGKKTQVGTKSGKRLQIAAKPE